jgi:biotin operon repressor
LASNLGIPAASVRRAIQELRRYGYKITLEYQTVRLTRG